MKSIKMDHSVDLEGRSLRPERWGEHFQDLSDWCQPNKMPNITSLQQSDEQLNTPIITVQDEFDFGMRSSEGPLMSEVDCDLWNTSIPNTHGELWESVNEWLTYSPEPLNETNNLFPKKELVKSNGDFLLSQSPISSKIKTEKTFESEQFKNCNKSDRASPLIHKIKKEPFFDMASIFQSEEPFINDVDSSCTFIIPDKLSSPIDIQRDDMVAAEEVVVTSDDTVSEDLSPISPATIKIEPSVYTPKERPKLTRSKLKLDIDAAMMSPQAETMDTPEVLQPLVDGIDGFSLLSYVCDDEANVLSTITSSSTKQMTCLTIPPQKRNETKIMPLGKHNVTKIGKRKRLCKVEIEESTTLPSCRPKRKSAENFIMKSKKHRFSNDSDVELDSIDFSDSDESYSVTSNRKRRTNIGRKRKQSVVDSDLESVSSTSDRYRELRDRNNEASRKSRLNRKSRESEMKAQAIQLEKDNRLLKIKADEMERLVKKLRDNLMQIVLKRS